MNPLKSAWSVLSKKDSKKFVKLRNLRNSWNQSILSNQKPMIIRACGRTMYHYIYIMKDLT